MQQIKIHAKSTGIGNQIQFIPFIQWMVRNHHYVITDSKVLPQLTDIDYSPKDKAPINFIVYGHSFWDMLRIRLTTLGRIYHFSPILKGKPLRLKNSVVFDFGVPELLNNHLLTVLFSSTPNSYKIPRTKKMIPGKVIIGATLRKGGLGFDKYVQLLRTVERISTVDDCILPEYHVDTPTIKDLYDELSTAEYYIGTDTGVTHLADIIGLKMVVIWGSNYYTKNKPVNKHKVLHKGLDCQPCSKNGQAVDCDYECMDFSVDEIINEL